MELKNVFPLAARTGRHMQRYNFLGHRQVVGCIPYRYRSPGGQSMVGEEDIEVLVITAQRKGKGMMFPKGGWEVDESIEEAALRETVEEAGVVGDVEHKLGKWSFNSKNRDTLYEGHMFPLLVKEQLEFWPEKDIRQRKWLSVREARIVCGCWWMKEALELLVNRVSSPGNEATTQVVNLVRAGSLALVANA
ncbi:nudix hydrolase-like protein 21 [Perilla frutescens var. hirtella]|uniref:Nudix hydrolase-like protein 21 n=1 Tax=Perilla frutescens var. hirtella TaxID=608512 RepID=A0AAD4IVV8_PERFH|nr:nudix hydrolase-like protein 21 [Perilla frutescens var. frutescens]KAH6784527.1 nudix hydrolase-like protein 21 [Perilla frutescens var. hirtella]KAH6822542.1 nudix hydrolase-like protein 21 [Perilla frutescens var. hirtella]